MQIPTDPAGHLLLLPGRTARERMRPALDRALWRLPENLGVAVLGGWTLVSPQVPLFAKTYSAGTRGRRVCVWGGAFVVCLCFVCDCVTLQVSGDG